MNMSMHSGHTAPTIAAAIAMVLAAAAANAQQLENQSGAGGVTALEKVIVTANKRSENIREVASSVSVFGGEQLENLNATQLSDFAAYVPGLQVVSFGTPGQASVSLRGIAPITSGANVGTYVDEAPLGSSGIYQRATFFALDLLPYDIERVEVLRGPQGTLYGAGAMGGLLKYVTHAPDLSEFEIRVGGGASDVEGAGGTGSILRFGANLPLAKDRAALRVSYARNDIPGFIDNSLDGDNDVNDGKQESMRAAFLWQASENFSLELTAMRQTIDSDDNGTVALDPVTGRPLNGDLENVIVVDEPFKKEIDYYALTLNWDLGWADLTAASGYSDASIDQRQDATFILGEFPLLFALPPGSSYFDLGLDLQKFTQELRLTSKVDGPISWQIGAFYTKEDADNSQFIALNQLDGTPLPAPFDGAIGTLADLTLPSDFKETAFFANGSYKFSDRFELGAGVRYSSDDQNFAQVVTGGILIPIGVTPGKSDENIFTWMVSPKWQLTDDVMLYARIATGYQPGGPNVALPGVPPQVDASELTSYELGLKSELADGDVLFDLAVYRIDWKDIQIGDDNGTTSWLINGGKAVSDGFELTTVYKATDQLRLGLNVAYANATVSNDVPSLGGLDGDSLPYIPDLSISATADYFFPVGSDWNGRVGGGLRWVDDRKTNLDSNPAAFNLDSYSAIDLNADLSNDNWTLRAYVKNLDDARSYQTIGDVTSAVTGVTHHLSATPIQPRTYGLEVDYRF